MKLCQSTINDPIIIVLYRNEFCETYILSNGHETCQSYNDQIIMKHMYMCIHLWSWSFVWIFTCMLSRQTLKLGYLDTTDVFSGEVKTLSCYRSDAIIMKFSSEQFVLKLCQIDNLCQWWGKLKLLLMKINFTFSGGQKLRIFRRSWNFLRWQFWNLEQFFWNFVRIIMCKKSPQSLPFLHFKASESVMPRQPGDTSDVEETSSFTAGFAGPRSAIGKAPDW